MSQASLLQRLGLSLPIIQAPMAGSGGAALTVAVSRSGGLGSLPCALLTPERMRSELGIIRQQTDRPFAVNFFCHTPPPADPARDAAWRAHLEHYYKDFGLPADTEAPSVNRAPFDETACQLVEEFKPPVVSFHFGLPTDDFVQRVKATGAIIVSSATSAREAKWLEDKGVDAVIAQGNEAGGHRGVFLDDMIDTQPGTLALVPQVADAVKIPVIAAGGIADGRGIAAALALGAEIVQIGTAYLFTQQATVSELHRRALAEAADDKTALTNLFSGRPARGLLNRVMREVGPMSPKAPAFPTAGAALAPLKAKAEAEGRDDFTQLWSGQSAAVSRPFATGMDAGDLTRFLAQQAEDVVSRLSVASKRI